MAIKEQGSQYAGGRRKAPRRVFGGAVAASVALALVAGCSSSGSSSDPGTSSASTATSGGSTSAPAGTPIKIGNIGTYGGKQPLPAKKMAFEAWVSYTNDHGGINGHPVVAIIKDDEQDPAKATAAVKDLIAQNVVAIVGNSSNLDPIWGPLAKAAGIPVIGGNPFNASFLTNPDFFSSGGNTIGEAYGIAQFAKAAGGKLAVVYCAEIPQCKGVQGVQEVVNKTSGVKIVYGAPVSATAPDYTATCQAIKNSGADAMYIALLSSIALRFTQACRAQGVTIPAMGVDGTPSITWLGEAAMDKSLVSESNFPFFDESTPATKTYQDAIDKYQPELKKLPEYGGIGTYTWVAGMLFTKAVQAIGAKEITPASVTDAMYTLKNETVDGLAPPLTFVKGQQTNIACYFPMKLEGDKYTEPSGMTPICMPPSDATAAANTLGLTLAP